MAGSVNKVIVLGNLGANPELKYLPSGQAVCEMRIATSETYKDRNEQPQERTEWHRVTVWGKTAENCSKFLQKGRQVYVEGRLQTRSWDDKEGKKQYMTEVVANQVVFLGGGGAGAGVKRLRGRRSPVVMPASLPVATAAELVAAEEAAAVMVAEEAAAVHRARAAAVATTATPSPPRCPVRALISAAAKTTFRSNHRRDSDFRVTDRTLRVVHG